VKIGIVGGTGDIGEGMALRLSPKYDVIVGSREEAKAIATCDACRETLHGQGLECSLLGVTNQRAVDEGDIVVLAIPFRHVAPTLKTLTGFEDKIVVSPVNPIERTTHFYYAPPPEGSAAMMNHRPAPAAGHRLCRRNGGHGLHLRQQRDDRGDLLGVSTVIGGRRYRQREIHQVRTNGRRPIPELECTHQREIP
jgi:hypothetical protein